MMLFEKSHKFSACLPTCGGTFSVGEIGPVGPRPFPSELLPDAIYD